MVKFCMCHHNYSDEPLYRAPYEVHFLNKENFKFDYESKYRSDMCRMEGVDSFLYFEQDEHIRQEITIKKSYSKYFKTGVYSFVENELEAKGNIILLNYFNRMNNLIYQVKIYDIEKYSVTYSPADILLDMELKISNFKVSHKMAPKKKNNKKDR